MDLDKSLQEKLERVLSAVEQMLPQPIQSIDWGSCLVANWTEQFMGGHLQAVLSNDAIGLEDLKAMDVQKQKVYENTQQLVAGFPANNVLLWGARGTGKSSLVRALLNEFSSQGLRLIQVNKYQLQHLPAIVGQLLDQPYKFILYCDDLSFEEGDSDYKELKSALDGSMFSLPDHVVIYATSNRRHLVPEYLRENNESKLVDGQIHHGDVVEEKISLSDRFGLWISFYPMDQQSYLQVVEHWLRKIAKAQGVSILWDEATQKESLKWALGRGTRSGRTAHQFARHWVGKLALAASST